MGIILQQRIAATGLAVVLALLGAAHPQQPTKQQADPEFSLRVGTDVVLVPVVVRHRGEHVRGLTEEDFTVLQDGKTRTIRFFEEVRPGKARLHRRPRLAPGVHTNLTPERQPHNLVLVLLDMLNTSPEAHARSRRELLRGLARSINEQTPTALFLLTERGVRLVHDFTGSPALLLGAIDQVANRREPATGTQRETVSTSDLSAPTAVNNAAAPVDPAAAGNLAARLDQMMEDINAYVEGLAAPIAAYKRGAAVASTLESLEFLARAYAGVPGRKSLLWVTAGFPFEALDESGRVGGGSVHRAYQQALRALTDANIALYPIDVRGLTTVGIGADPTRYARRARDEAPLIDAEYNEMMSRASNMETLAKTTGGRAFLNTNDVGGAFEQAAQDSSSYYLLGYYLDRENAKPGWHKLGVKIERPNVDVRARQGFFLHAAESDSAEARQQDIAAALQAPVDYTQLPIFLRWNHVEPTSNGRKAVFEIDVAPGAVAADQQNRLNLEFVVLASTLAGQKVGDVAQHYTATLGPEGRRRISESGVTYSNHIVVPPGRYNVRVVVRDNISGRTGSVAAPLIAP